METTSAISARILVILPHSPSQNAGACSSRETMGRKSAETGLQVFASEPSRGSAWMAEW